MTRDDPVFTCLSNCHENVCTQRELSLFGLGASFPVLLPFISWVMLSSANDLAFRKRK